MCPGMQFGLATMELPLAQLLYYFDWELPTESQSLDMSETVGISAHRKFDLLFHATSHVPILPRGTVGSLSPTLVPAPHMSLAVKLPNAFALEGQSPSDHNPKV